MLLELVFKALAVVALAILLVTAYLYFTQRSQLYFPWSDAAVDPPPGVEAIELRTDDGLRLGAWFIPAADEARPAANGPGPAVLVCNGNAGYRAHRLPLAQALSQQGYHVLLFDYRGYAGNPGSPSQDGLLADARAAARALAERPDVDPARIAYFGESLGASVCGGLAVELPPVVLILRSPMPSVEAVARHHYPFLPIVGPLIWDPWPLERQLAEDVPVPLLVLIAERDDIVPPALSRRVYAAAEEPKRLVVIPASHHNDESLLVGEELVAEITAFLSEYLRGSARSGSERGIGPSRVAPRPASNAAERLNVRDQDSPKGVQALSRGQLCVARERLRSRREVVHVSRVSVSARRNGLRAAVSRC